jgi:hypothetical protein
MYLGRGEAGVPCIPPRARIRFQRKYFIFLFFYLLFWAALPAVVDIWFASIATLPQQLSRFDPEGHRHYFQISETNLSAATLQIRDIAPVPSWVGRKLRLRHSLFQAEGAQSFAEALANACRWTPIDNAV